MARRKNTKRGKGEGSVFELPNGTWRGKVTVGYKEDGTQRFRWVSGKTQADALKKLNAVKTAFASGIQTSGTLKLSDYLGQWTDLKEDEVKPKTLAGYRQIIELYIKPQIGHVKLEKVTTANIRALLATVKDAVSPDAANKARKVLNTALRQAVHDALIPRNPVTPTKLYKVPKTVYKEWAAPEITRFLATAKDHRLYAAFYLTLTTGLRHGELLGLRWQDLGDDTLHICQNLVSVKGQNHISTPKTESGTRHVLVDSETLEILEQHRLQQATEQLACNTWGAPPPFDDLMFTTREGKPLAQRNFDRIWYRLMDSANVPRIRFHDLRHTHVSMLYRAGTDLQVISDRLGHKDPSFTQRQYNHLTKKQKQTAVKSLSSLLIDQ